LVVGLLNIVLGYFLALALADPPLFGLLTHSFWLHALQRIASSLRRPPIAPVEVHEAAVPEASEEPGPPVVVARAPELPEAWQQTLREEGIPAAFLAGGSAHVLRFEGAVYRDRLFTAESRARQFQSAQDSAAVEQLAADLRFVNVDWVRKLRQGADLIEDRTGRLGAAEAETLKLAAFLRDEAAQVSDIDREIHTLDFRAEGTLGSRRLLLELHRLLHLANRLQDEIAAR